MNPLDFSCKLSSTSEQHDRTCNVLVDAVLQNWVDFLGHFKVTFAEARSGTEHSTRLGVALPVPDFMRR